MKHKGLTIFFVAIMAVAATPQAIRQLRGFVATAQERAQVEWLRLVVSLHTEGTESAPKAEQPRPCAKQQQVAARSAKAEKAQERVAQQPSQSTRTNSAMAHYHSVPARGENKKGDELAALGLINNPNVDFVALSRNKQEATKLRAEAQKIKMLKLAGPQLALATRAIRTVAVDVETENLLRSVKHYEKIRTAASESWTAEPDNQK